MSSSLRILAVFAHPDDEIGIGSTLAHYGDAGIYTALVCASRGEAATIYCTDCATPETLAEVRTHELECACKQLGIGELRWLDWPDGGIGALPREEAIGQVVGQIRQLRPHVLITHPENGLYPHPDHVAIWEIAREAYHAAADASRYPDAGAPWSVSRLFTRALPQSFFDAAPDFAKARVELNGSLLPFYATPDDEIDVVMRVAPWVARRMAAWDCHRSQQNPEGAFSRMPDGIRQEMAENEHFLLADARVPLPDGEHDDLLAGLSEEPVEEQASPAHVATLRGRLAHHRALLIACQGFSGMILEPPLHELIKTLIEQEQEALYLLARAMRAADAAPGGVEPDPIVVDRAHDARSVRAKYRFFRHVVNGAMAFYRTAASSTLLDSERQLWETLRELTRVEVEACEATLVD